MSWQPDPRPVTWTNVGGTIASGGVAQTVQCGSSGSPVRGFIIQNPSTATESLFFEPNGVATANSLEILPGGAIVWGPGTIFAGNAPSIFAVTTAHRFICYYGQ